MWRLLRDGCYALGPFTQSNPGHSICVPNHTYGHIWMYLKSRLLIVVLHLLILAAENKTWQLLRDGCYTLGPFTQSNPWHSICVPNHTYGHRDVFKVKTIDCSIAFAHISSWKQNVTVVTWRLLHFGYIYSKYPKTLNVCFHSHLLTYIHIMTIDYWFL